MVPFPWTKIAHSVPTGAPADGVFPHNPPAPGPPQPGAGPFNAIDAWEKPLACRFAVCAKSRGFLGEPFQLRVKFTPPPRFNPPPFHKLTRSGDGALYLLYSANSFYLVLSYFLAPLPEPPQPEDPNPLTSLLALEPTARALYLLSTKSAIALRRFRPDSFTYYLHAEFFARTMRDIWDKVGDPAGDGLWLSRLLTPGTWGAALRILTPRHHHLFVNLTPHNPAK